MSTAQWIDRIEKAVEDGAGVPQEIIPQAALLEIKVWAPVMTLVDRMVPIEWNTNQETTEVFHELLNSIRDEGFSGAVEVVPFAAEDGQESYLIAHGEHRWRAAKILGLREIPASRITHEKFKDEDFLRIVSVRRNNIRGQHDRTKFRALVAELAEKYKDQEALRRLLVFTKSSEWNHLVGATKKALKDQGASPEMLRRFEEKAKNARSLADLSTIVSHLFETHKGTVPCGFMVFSFGGKEHAYVSASKGTMTSLKRVLAHCEATGLEVNSVLGPMLHRLAESLVEARAVEEAVSGADLDEETPF